MFSSVPVINKPFSFNSNLKFSKTALAFLLEIALEAMFRPLRNSSRLIVNLILIPFSFYIFIILIIIIESVDIVDNSRILL